MDRAEARVVPVSTLKTPGPHVRPTALRDIVRLLRPTQWSKNAVMYAALIFSKHLFDLTSLSLVTLGFIAFCAMASGAYVMNDIRDCERDRQHPLKSLRPLPAGRVRPATA